MELTKKQIQIIEPLKNISIELYEDQLSSMSGMHIAPREYNLTESQIQIARKIRVEIEDYNNSKDSAYDMIIEGTNKLKRIMR